MQAQPTRPKRKPTGIEERHARSCRSLEGGNCNCEPSYRAYVWDRRAGEKIKKTFAGKGALADAKAWRSDALSGLHHGKAVGPSKQTLAEIAEEWLEGVKADPPTVMNRSGIAYKPSAWREYERNWKNYLRDELGAHRLSEIRRGDLQALVDRLVGKGLSGSKVRNIMLVVRVLYRYAIERDRVETNPTTGLRLPNGHTSRDRAATASEAAELLAALPDEIRPVYACAFYGGLRRGELRGLKWDDVDLAGGIIHVRRGWDDQDGAIVPKSKAGARTVPIVALLRDHLAELKARTGRGTGDFVFGPKADRPFTPSDVRKKAAKAWEAANTKRAEGKLDPLVPIGLHECRHTFVSLLHDAGLSLERIGDYVGHSSAYMTDRYRHLLEGHEAEAAKLLDAYLARADTAARLEQLEPDVDRPST
jgi:integrase